MELNYTTTSRLEHKTSIKPDVKTADGGREALIKAFDFIRSQQQVGELTVQFGPGGSVSSMTFREYTRVAQKELDFAAESE